MCSGRVDLAFVLRAFSKGIDGVFIGGCWPGECHYITEGNYDALSMVHIGKKLLQNMGIHTKRLRLEWVSASEGIRFAEIMHDFASQLKKVGPLGLEKDGLKVKLDAAIRLVPYIKLVEREKLRVPTKNAQAYEKFFASEEINSLIQELILDKLELMQIMALGQKNGYAPGKLSEILRLPPAQVSKHLKTLVRHALVRF